MQRSRDRRTSLRGSALVPVLVLLTGVLVMGYVSFRSALSDQKSVRQAAEEKRAFFLAEAGLHEGFEALRTGRSGGVGSLEAPAFLGGGVLWVSATPLGDDRTRLVSTAMVGRGRQALEAVIHLASEEPPIFVATLNSKEVLTLNEGVLIDSFDSELGSYASQALNMAQGRTYALANGDARSNEKVVLNANAKLFGDAIPGPGYGVELNTGSYVDGSTVAASEPFVFPEIEYPSFTPLGNYAVASGGSAALAPGNYDFDTFSIDRNARLTVTGPATIVVDDFVGGKTANLSIDARNGPVTFYVRNTYAHISGFQLQPVDGSPMLAAFFVGGRQDVTFPANTPIRGAYYAPNADIVFANGNECWGAFAANRISMSNDMKFHFDEALLRHWSGETGDEGDPLTVLSWRKTAVSPTSLLTDRRDPLQVLGLEAGDLLFPGPAWAD